MLSYGKRESVRKKKSDDDLVFFFGDLLAEVPGEKGGQASRRISNTKLKSLLIVHLYPIELVVFKLSSGI